MILVILSVEGTFSAILQDRHIFVGLLLYCRYVMSDDVMNGNALDDGCT